MYRKLFVSIALLIMFGLLQAQETDRVPAYQLFPLEPTYGPLTPDQAVKNSDGSTKASVIQQVHLNIPAATALHLDLTTILFDLAALDGDGWPHASDPLAHDKTIQCVYGLTLEDQKSPLGEKFWFQEQVLPLGTSYNTTTWPNIAIKGGGQVTSYPPIRLVNNELVPGSKNYFVCYKSFILQKFSNYKFWDLSVTRNHVAGSPNIEHLYIQDNTCPSFHSTAGGAATGMYELGIGQTRHLIPIGLNAGPTGTQTTDKNLPASCRHKSWLDDLVVIAVKINADHYGLNKAELVYTLTSSDAQFTPEKPK